jgi:alkanesulfonate monooxygenase SsuD/methylene tetrahydromethanopterin reductase-like flavin-dependent oxidoreductase (luciferase family)
VGDLATFQDHPYQPAFLDTWTLLAWVAAPTERVRVSANVLNLPLRPPAVVARAAASLDLLSGGRFELGLGAGAFWDAIEAMGGARRTPGESVEALEEAIEIIRAIWDPTERRGVYVDGEHYRVVGAKRGPEPAHDNSIWLGALKPRMLRLIGRRADGWLPSYSSMEEGDLERGNRIIDEAAIEEGRDPREIRRLLNVGGVFATSNRGFLQGPPEQWVEELLPLRARERRRYVHPLGGRPRRNRAVRRGGRARAARGGRAPPRDDRRAPRGGGAQPKSAGAAA